MQLNTDFLISQENLNIFTLETLYFPSFSKKKLALLKVEINKRRDF